MNSANNKLRFLTIKEIRKIMLEGTNMPTNIFSAKKKEYIVKPRETIFIKSRRN